MASWNSAVNWRGLYVCGVVNIGAYDHLITRRIIVNYRNASIWRPGCLFTFGNSREGSY